MTHSRKSRGHHAVPLRCFALACSLMVVLSACGSLAGPSPSGTPPSTRAGVSRTPTPVINPTPQTRTAKAGGTLVLANRGDPPAAFDTMRTSSIALHHPGGAIFGPGNLVKRCRENIYFICPDLAERWFANSDFTQWSFQIRRDAFWHDGVPFTTEDAKFWIDLAVLGVPSGEKTRAPAYFKGEISDIKSTEALSGNVLRVTLEQPSYFFVEKLTNPRLKIAHPAHLMQHRIQGGDVSPAPLDVNAVGTGPFRLTSYEKGSVIKVRGFDRYWERDNQGRRMPYLDGIDFAIMEDPAVMDAAFWAGRLDGGARGEGHYLTAERQRAYLRSSGSDVYFGEMQGGLFRLAFNVLKPGPWQDVRVRRAVGLWTEKTDAIPSVLGGRGYLAPFLGPNNPLTSKDFLHWPGFDSAERARDKLQAKRLMAEAGYAEGFPMGHLCRAQFVDRCEFLRGQLAGLGIHLQVHVADEAKWNDLRVTLGGDSQQGAFFSPPTAEATQSVFGRASRNPDAYAKHEDNKVDQFYANLRSFRDQRTRLNVWRELERYIVLDRAYVVPIAGTFQVVPYHRKVQGIFIPAEDGHTNTDFATAWLNR